MEIVNQEQPPGLNPAQQQVIDRGLMSAGFDLVLQMPTGAGKTWLAEEAIARVLAEGRRAIYVTPLRALADEIVSRWRDRFSDGLVGVFTGDYGQAKAYPVPFDQARVLVMTPERLDACTRRWRAHWGWIPQVELVVIDELHLLGDPRRGPRLEGALTRFRRLNPFVQTVGLSATLGNRKEISAWLGGVDFASDWRPIPLAWRVSRYRQATDKPRLLSDEVRRCLSGGGQSLVFVQSRRRAESLAAGLREEGVAAEHHHAGLEAERRRGLEARFRSGQTPVLVSTGTLEMGLNLPARQVVLYDLQRFNGRSFEPLAVSSVWQRAGRAGRRGLDESGEVVLLAPTWDRTAEQYLAGRFEPIRSRLADTGALAEQILAEVASGLARTRPQVERALAGSLAGHQGRLGDLGHTIDEMLESGMLAEQVDTDGKPLRLRATRLGHIAVRQMLAPSTVLKLARTLSSDGADALTFLDLLLVSVSTDDCELRLPVDFEELEELSGLLCHERSTILSAGEQAASRYLGASGQGLLAIIKTALALRSWTRSGDAESVAGTFGCYPTEVRGISESVGRVATAAVAVVSPEKGPDVNPERTEPEPQFEEIATIQERVRALASMVANGIDEGMATLTLVDGIGGGTARRLSEAGVRDIEELALADPILLAGVRGVSRERATQWVERATALLSTRSALSLIEEAPPLELASEARPRESDPYRFRRALSLRVTKMGSAWEVTGGLEPHLVKRRGEGLVCDCQDATRGNRCKHSIAVSLVMDDGDSPPPVPGAQGEPQHGIDLFRLWFDRGAA